MLISEPHACLTGAVRPGDVEVVVFLPPGFYARWMREVGFPRYLRYLYEAHPEHRNDFKKMQEDHLSRLEEHVALVIMARVVDSEDLLTSDSLEPYLHAEWGLAEIPYETERYFPVVLLRDVPAKIQELYQAGDIRPYEFPWESGL
jgi:hypothetical protein